MFIQTETTPNPETLKFIPNQAVLPEGHSGRVEEYTSAEEATSSPLARALFLIDGIKAVLFAKDFISVTKEPACQWMVLKPLLLGTIMDHFVSNRPVLSEKSASLSAQATGCGAGCACASASGKIQSGHVANDEGDDGAGGKIIAQIKDLLETRVRPALARDGGDVSFVRYSEGVVTLRMRGACAGCPSAQATMKNGIENLLRHFVPEVREVVGG